MAISPPSTGPTAPTSSAAEFATAMRMGRLRREPNSSTRFWADI